MNCVDRGNVERVFIQITTEKVCFLLSLFPPLPHPFAAKECKGGRRGEGSEI
jgi:hypothetical protein